MGSAFESQTLGKKYSFCPEDFVISFLAERLKAL